MRERAVRWVSGTGGRGQSHSLSYLGRFSASAFDRLTCIHPPAQEGPQAHTGVPPTRSQTHVHMHNHLTTSSYWCSSGDYMLVHQFSTRRNILCELS